MHLNLGSILQGSADLRRDHVAVRLNERTLTYARRGASPRACASAASLRATRSR